MYRRRNLDAFISLRDNIVDCEFASFIVGIRRFCDRRREINFGNRFANSALRTDTILRSSRCQYVMCKPRTMNPGFLSIGDSR